MIEACLYAFLMGIFLSFGFGSVFFVLLQNSIEYGRKAGFKIASGVLSSDVVLVAVALMGTSFLPDIPNFENYARAICVVLLFAMALGQFRKTTSKERFVDFRAARFIYYYAKGFMLNIINPVNFLTWVVIIGGIKSYQLSQNQTILFFVICLSTIFLSECVIAHYASKLKVFLNPKTLSNIKRLTAIIFIIIATKIAYDGFI